MYAIKEIYYTIQGEGFHTGRPAVFVRFSGCNLWTGREEDRHKAICQFCDTDFWGTDGVEGGKYTKESLSTKIKELWPIDSDKIFIVCTGGEPALQLDQELVDYLHQKDIEIAIETNGTLALPDHIDWICMSPKAHTEIVVSKGHEIKIVFPQKGIDPSDFESLDYQHYYLQPMDSVEQEENIFKVQEYCLLHPKWKMSLQTHKILGIK